MEYTIDATDKSIGRIASQAAVLLRGKDSAAFERHTEPKNKVTITGASKVKIAKKKFVDMYFKHHTGWTGGMKYQTLEEVIAKKGFDEVFRLVIKGMLPDNKLRPIMMKNLTIVD